MSDDAPEIAPEMFAKMRPLKDMTPGMAEAVMKMARGRHHSVRCQSKGGGKPLIGQTHQSTIETKSPGSHRD